MDTSGAKFKEDDTVYHRDTYWYRAQISYLYTSANGTPCAHLYNGVNCALDDLRTEAEHAEAGRRVLDEIDAILGGE
jgi:hypothetical protein